MYRPPEMCDRYLNYNVNEKADIWVRPDNILDARVRCFYHRICQTPIRGAAKISDN